MADDDQDDAQKTEDPTPKRLEEAFKKGQKATSREVNHFFLLVAFAFMIASMLPGIMVEMHSILQPYIASPDQFAMDMGNFSLNMKDLLVATLIVFIPALVMFIVAALASGMVQNRINFALDSVTPKWEKISPLKGLKRMFSLRSVVEFLKGIIKITIVGMVGFAAVYASYARFELLPNTALEESLELALDIAVNMLVGVCAIVFLIAAMDYSYQKFEFLKNLRMTKQEVKDEYKQQEGDPQVKQRLRQIRMERARNNMMAAVQEADVIVTNPTHYSIALKYDAATMNAPLMVAKGDGDVALRIRELAERHDIPLVRNPPLARLLFADAEINEQIPLNYYKAVAEIIGYVYRLKGIIPEVTTRNTPRK